MSIMILEIAKSELSRLNPDSVNYFDWRKRREIYKLLNADSTTTSNPRHKLLAIQSAELVFPLFRPIYPHDSLVFDLLEGAKAFSENRVDNFEKLDETEDRGYHIDFGYDYENEERDYQSSYAGFAAYKALVEVRHMIDPWEGIDHLSRGKNVVRFSSKLDHAGWISGQEFTDEEWNHLAAFGDTAAAASFAYSTSRISDQCQPRLLYEFWKWWVEVALPKALS